MALEYLKSFSQSRRLIPYTNFPDDMVDFAGKVPVYTNGVDQAGFVASGLTYDATLRNLELIGEAATPIPDEVRAAHLEIRWRMKSSSATPAPVVCWTN